MALGRWVLAFLVSGVLVGACARRTPGPTPTPTLTPTPARTPTSTPASTPTSAPTSTPAPTDAGTPDPDAELKEIRDYLAIVFPPGPGREDLFLTCTNCHGIHLVILTGVNMDRTEWEAVRTRHDTGGGKWQQAWTGRQEGQDLLYEYLVAHLGRDKPPLPPMPERLNEGWAQY